MRKVISLLIALVLAFAMAIPVFADDYNMDKDVDSVNSLLTYGVSQSYMISIPSIIAFEAVEGLDGLYADALIEAKDVYIAGDETLNIAIASKNETTTAGEAGAEPIRQWWMIDANLKTDGVTPASVPVRYQATIPENGGTAKLYNGKNILSVGSATGDAGTTSDAKGEVNIDFATAGTAQNGDYKDILTFFVSVDKESLPSL